MLRTILSQLQKKSEEGQALVEYGLILSLIVVACMSILVALAGEVDGLYKVIETAAAAMKGDG